MQKGTVSAATRMEHDAPQAPTAGTEGMRARFGLTRAEAGVAMLIADGLSATEIAAHLGISVYTVRAHLRRIYSKTGVNRQVALVRLILMRRP
jgi:DNA-binding CsgD family transcriptional regulator